jgi:transcriptional regulator with XRE-family HTH domain
MNEKILDDAIRSGLQQGEIKLDLNDAVVDGLLDSPPWQVPLGGHERARKKLQARRQDTAIAAAKEVISNRHLLPLGRFLEAVRENAKLTKLQIAERLGKDETFVLRVERGDISPVSVPVAECADIMGLFQIGVGVTKQMIAASVKTAESKRTYRAAARSHGGIRSDIRSQDVERALDAFARKMHRNVTNTEDNAEIRAYLTELEQELRKRGRADLLK